MVATSRGEREDLLAFASYPASTVAALCSSLRAIQGGTTEFQRSQLLAQYSGLPPAEASSIGDFIERECSSLIDLFAPQPAVNQVLAPPVNTCYECYERLVANHRCQVRFYSPTGVSSAEKITLRCTTCSLFYNYAQYGNKRVRGFRYYSEERAVVEVSDTTFFDCCLLELQCSLANHAWVSFQGFAESYNDTYNLPRNLGENVYLIVYIGDHRKQLSVICSLCRQHKVSVVRLNSCSEDCGRSLLQW